MTSSCPSNTSNVASNGCKLLARAYANRSYAYFQQKDYSRARSDAEQAVKLDPNLAEARINLANARLKQNDRTGALNDYKQALKLNLSKPLKAGVFNNMGNLMFAQNNAQAAIQDYSQAIGQKSDYADAYYNRGLAYSNSNNPNNAISDFQTAARYYRTQKNYKLADEAQQKPTSFNRKTLTKPRCLRPLLPVKHPRGRVRNQELKIED